MTTVKLRDTFFITETLAGAGNTFQTHISIPEGVDEIRVVQLIYTGNEQTLCTLIWDSVGKIALFSGQLENANINIRVNVHGKVIQGLQTFRIVNFQGLGPNPALGGVLGVVLEYIKY